MASEKAEEIIGNCARASESGLEAMRAAAKDMFGEDSRFIIGANGSYARREVTNGSDVDLFFLAINDDPTSITDEQDKYMERLRQLGYKLPAAGGVFSEPQSVITTRNTIGGQEDDNVSITRRMLLLLEGEWVFNEAAFETAHGMLLDRYLKDVRRNEQICLFLLNDIIRYWRTICVDYEFKISQGDKARAVRLIKLRFSRLMLYLAGVLAVAETYDKPVSEKGILLRNLLRMPALERFRHIVGDKGEAVVELYADFLRALNDGDIRKKLEIKGPDAEETEEFKSLRGKAREFRDIAYEVLNQQYGAGHPVLAALVL